MMRSLFSGVSGLKTHQTKMDVIGNNIANVNTVAFKSSATSFSDIMYQLMSGASGATATKGGVNPNQIGLGVATGATKVSIAHGGAAQSTGEALDLRLSDTKSTNFFVVNNGTENVFTRSGSFYLDGNGNLAMTSTGYLVMGWQVDPQTNTIARDVVSPLRIMSPENLTSEPEYTSQAIMKGVLDDTDVNVNSTEGYATTLVFYDNLGYAYTARFAIKKGKDEPDSNGVVIKNGYTIELTNIYSNNDKDAAGNPVDIYKNYLDQGDPTKVSDYDLFGSPNGTEYDTFKLQASNDGSGYNYQKGFGSDTTGDYIVHKSGSHTYGIKVEDLMSYISTNLHALSESGKIPSTAVKDEEGHDGVDFDLSAMFKGLKSCMSSYDEMTEKPTFTFDSSSQSLKVAYKSTNYSLYFNTNDGTFASIDGAAYTDKSSKAYSASSGEDQILKMSTLGSQFSDINIDFSQMLNYYNGGSSTVGMDTGTAEDASLGAGKKLGAMTGIAVQQDGKIFGSYDNGNTVLLGQIAVAQFANASGLEQLGDNCYATTLNSGEFDGIGVEITADGSSMETGQLEMSNVDLSTEFTEMITTQRGFQANSRIITVSDTMLEELTNLKR